MEQSAGDGDALGLTFAESTTPLSQFGVESVGQVEDEVGTGGMEHSAQFVVGGVGAGQLEVVADGAAHQGIALRHETQFSTHGDLATCRFDETTAAWKSTVCCSAVAKA